MDDWRVLRGDGPACAPVASQERFALSRKLAKLSGLPAIWRASEGWCRHGVRPYFADRQPGSGWLPRVRPLHWETGKTMKLRIGVYAALALGMALFASSARAATINQLIGGPPGVPYTEITADDNDRERVIDVNPNGTAGIIDAGDILEGVMRMDKLGVDLPGVPSVTKGLDGELNSQFYGYFSVQVASKTYHHTTGGIDYYLFTFAPHSGFDTNNDGTMVRMYEHSAVSGTSDDEIQFDVDGTGSITKVINGTGGSTSTHYWSLGYVKPSNGWFAIAPDDPTNLPINFTEEADAAWFALSRTAETPTGPGTGGDWNLLVLTGTAGRGEFTGSIKLGPADQDAKDWQVESTVKGGFQIAPLPIAAFPGIAMVGLVVLSSVRRRRRAA